MSSGLQYQRPLKRTVPSRSRHMRSMRTRDSCDAMNCRRGLRGAWRDVTGRPATQSAQCHSPCSHVTRKSCAASFAVLPGTCMQLIWTRDSCDAMNCRRGLRGAWRDVAGRPATQSPQCHSPCSHNDTTSAGLHCAGCRCHSLSDCIRALTHAFIWLS